MSGSLVIVDEIYEFADTGEKGEFGVGGGASFLVEVVVKLTKKYDKLSGIAQKSIQQKIMILHVLGQLGEFFYFVNRGECTGIKNDEIKPIGGDEFANFEHWRLHTREVFKKVFQVKAVILVFRDDEDTGCVEFECGHGVQVVYLLCCVYFPKF